MSGFPIGGAPALILMARIDRLVDELVAAGAPKRAARKIAPILIAQEDRKAREDRHLADIREGGT
jgi:hypothetical protein